MRAFKWAPTLIDCGLLTAPTPQHSERSRPGTQPLFAPPPSRAGGGGISTRLISSPKSVSASRSAPQSVYPTTQASQHNACRPAALNLTNEARGSGGGNPAVARAPPSAPAPAPLASSSPAPPGARCGGSSSPPRRPDHLNARSEVPQLLVPRKRQPLLPPAAGPGAPILPHAAGSAQLLPLCPWLVQLEIVSGADTGDGPRRVCLCASGGSLNLLLHPQGNGRTDPLLVGQVGGAAEHLRQEVAKLHVTHTAPTLPETSPAAGQPQPAGLAGPRRTWSPRAEAGHQVRCRTARESMRDPLTAAPGRPEAARSRQQTGAPM
eukprot:scaffold11294_cov117-Isochrysis_galbana.AAC.6